MSDLRDFRTIVGLTIHEALRRRVLVAALVCGLAFLALFGTGLHFVLLDVEAKAGFRASAERAMVLTMLTLAGLYAINFLTVMAAVLLPVDTLAGEISSGVIQTLASKPVRRATIVLGKWAAYAMVVTSYFAFLAIGLLAIVRVRGGYLVPHPEIGLPLIALEAVVLVSVCIAAGTRLSTVTTGIVTFGLFGLAFIGNWVEQIGTLTENDAARVVGTIASLLMPSESLWMLAAHHMQPPITSQLGLTPFSPLSVPSPAMVAWAVLHVVAMLAVALRGFGKRAL